MGRAAERYARAYGFAAYLVLCRFTGAAVKQGCINRQVTTSSAAQRIWLGEFRMRVRVYFLS